MPAIPFDIQIPMNSADNQAKTNIDYTRIQSILKISRHIVDMKMLLDDIQQIEKDIPRTTLFNDNRDDMDFSERLKSILITFAAFHQNLSSSTTSHKVKNNLGYTQGFGFCCFVVLSLPKF